MTGRPITLASGERCTVVQTVTGARTVPEGYQALDSVDARDLAPASVLYTRRAAPDAPLGWRLAAVLVERVRESGAGDDGQIECAVVDVSIPKGDGRITLAYAPEDLLRLTPRRGTVGS